MTATAPGRADAGVAGWAAFRGGQYARDGEYLVGKNEHLSMAIGLETDAARPSPQGHAISTGSEEELARTVSANPRGRALRVSAPGTVLTAFARRQRPRALAGKGFARGELADRRRTASLGGTMRHS